MDIKLLEIIKKLTLRALVGDEILMKGLVLKGGNALQMAYDITSRGSIDIDFSIANDFSESDKQHIHVRLEILLNIEFEKEDLRVFDVNFYEKPKANEVKEWKGYCIDFKTIELSKFNSLTLQESRTSAIAVKPNNSTKFTVDISSYEYTDGKKMKEIDGAVMYVYTPEMILFEKIRALCQTIPDYQTIVKSANVKGRARDVYDIWNICDSYPIDFSSSENRMILKEIFAAKRVPLDFIDLIEKYKDIRAQDWSNVQATVTGNLEPFDFYFDFLMGVIRQLKS
jgi:predicted nucleotidyltransferase component of viral defense system